jgi:hypothetical protein
LGLLFLGTCVLLPESTTTFTSEFGFVDTPPSPQVIVPDRGDGSGKSKVKKVKEPQSPTLPRMGATWL